MSNDPRNFLISNRHKRLQRLWQFFFAGWGTVIIVAVIAGALLNNSMLWTPITDLLMSDVIENQFRMTNPSFAGTDPDGNPFAVRATVAYQQHGNENQIFLETVNATIVRPDASGRMSRNKIRGDHGIYDRATDTVTMRGNVVADSDNGDKIRTNEMVIKL